MGSDSHKKKTAFLVYFWLLGQVLCEAQRREHSLSYVTGVVTKHDCMDAGAVAVSA